MIDLKSMTNEQLTVFWGETIFTLNQGELCELYLYIFLELRDDYSNDLPQEMLHVLREQQSQREENRPIDYDKYKCRANYICGLASRLEAVV